MNSAWKWCFTKDWATPAEGEAWHGAPHYEICYQQLTKEIERRKIPRNNYNRFIPRQDNHVVVDFGSHHIFGLIVLEKAK